ncbi:MAG: PA2169 family four-helix-bundle protein [Pyrinomonadaceae bacterium]|nr:PA2169 family four-helix-bundle protein [Pyrinomonadaceae bacterium]
MLNEREIKNVSESQSETLTNDEVINVLNRLIETSKDGHEGFKQAAENIPDSDLKTAFYEFSQQRSQFVGELQEFVRELGGNPENSGSVLGIIHRGWIDLKTAILGNDTEAILNEVERGEDTAKSNYQDALDKIIPANIRSAIENQYYTIKASHDRVKIMRDVSKAAHNANR